MFQPPVLVQTRDATAAASGRPLRVFARGLGWLERGAREVADWLAPACCAACDAPVEATETFCADCGPCPPAPQPAPLGALVGGAYAPPLSTAIKRLKFARRADLAARLAQLLPAPADARGALVVPVPLHVSRLVARGFNPPALLARCWCQRLGAELAPEVLWRWRDTPHQSKLAACERAANVEGAFVACRGALSRRGVVPLAGPPRRGGSGAAALGGVFRSASGAEPARGGSGAGSRRGDTESARRESAVEELGGSAEPRAGLPARAWAAESPPYGALAATARRAAGDPCSSQLESGRRTMWESSLHRSRAARLGELRVELPPGARGAPGRRGPRCASSPGNATLAQSRRAFWPVESGLGQADAAIERGREAAGGESSRRSTGVERRVILVDDVVTTGATLEACRRALYAAGVVHVTVVVLAATPLV